MNANELADVLEDSQFQICDDGTTVGVSRQAVDEAATMLRQQQAEKEELEVGLKNVWKIVENKQAEIEALKAELRGIDELITGKAQEK